MCRVCMDESDDLLDIYDNKSWGDRLSADLQRTKEPEPTPADLLNICSAYPVDTGDGFPLKICEPCLIKLREALRFKRRYTRTMEYVARVKREQSDKETCDLLEAEDWDFADPIKRENEEEEEDRNGDGDDKQLKKENNNEVDKKRPFKCADCPKSFAGKAQLTLHSRTHTKVSTRTKRKTIK
uniref:CG17361 protein n=1 Tax=Drosophila simulans TaxID=7240 RepID=A0APC7_DROSI|nr:CG17361 [Drosophila simulans]